MTHKHLPPLIPLLAANEEYRAIITAHPAYADLIPLYTAWKEAEQRAAAAYEMVRSARAKTEHLRGLAWAQLDPTRIHEIQPLRESAAQDMRRARLHLQVQVQVVHLRTPPDPREVEALREAVNAAETRWQEIAAAHKAAREVYEDAYEAKVEQIFATEGDPRPAEKEASVAHEAAILATSAAYAAYTKALEASPLSDFLEWPS